MARKFLQMGYTRARRYVNYKGGRKYDKDNNYALKERGAGDSEKAESAAIFRWVLEEGRTGKALRRAEERVEYG